MKTKNLLKSILLVTMVFTCGLISAQEEESPSKVSFDLGADITSRYIWRGIQFSEAPAIQPWAELTAGNFAIGVWGSYETGGEVFGQELDFYASYAFGPVSLMLTDYSFPKDEAAHADHPSETDLGGGDHFGELALSFDGVEGFPLSAMIGVFVYGDDHNSVYTEIGYPFEIDGVALNAFVSAGDGDYTEDASFGLSQIGISAAKELKVNDNYSIGASVATIYNPDRDQTFLTFTISL